MNKSNGDELRESNWPKKVEFSQIDCIWIQGGVKVTKIQQKVVSSLIDKSRSWAHMSQVNL